MSDRNQMMAAVAAILQVVDWNKVELQDLIEAANGGKLGPALTKWLGDKGWFPRPPPLVIDRSISPVCRLGPEWSVWLGPADGNGLEGEPDVDPRAGAVTTFDVSKVRFLSGLVEGESSITGEERLKRLRIGTDIQIDAQTFWALYTEKGQVTLRWLHDFYGVNWIEELGTILRCPDGRRYSLVLDSFYDGSWDWGFRQLCNNCDADNPAIGLQVA